MLSRLIPVMGVMCAVLLGVYLMLLTTAIFFAASQTELSLSLREAESRVGALETEYYAEIARISGADLYANGLVTPTKTEYVAADGRPSTFTRAETR